MHIIAPTYQEIADTKSFKSTSLTFQHPKDILKPVLDQIGHLADSITYQAVVGSVNVNDDLTDNRAYSHLMMQASFGSEFGLEDKLLFIYRLDKAPSVTIASGPMVSACMNMCVFGSKYRQTSDPTRNGFSLAYSFLSERFLPNRDKWKDEALDKVAMLRSQVIPQSQIETAFGKVYREVLANRSGISLDSDLVNAAVRQAFTPEAMWSVHKNPEWTKWDMFNCLTQGVKHKAMDGLVDKSVACYRLVTEVVDAY